MNPEDFISIQDVISWYLYPKISSISKETKQIIKFALSLNQGNIFVCDVTLKIQGHEEEKIFTHDSIVRNNIRRGNSMLLILKSDSTQNFQDYLKQIRTEKTIFNSNLDLSDIINAVWVRRGLTKFFDISIDYLKNSLKLKEKNIEDKEDAFLSSQIIFNPIKKALNLNKSIEVYQLEKVNGENVQVSYIRLLDKWIISSKNCSVIVRNQDELEEYLEKRYEYACKIAKTWLQMLDSIRDLNGFINWINEKTMIGEYVGNPDCQHIVKYQKEEIIFYAVVENNSAYSCIPVIESYYYFRKFNIRCTGIKKIGRFFGFGELCQSLVTTFMNISIEDLNMGGEGSVIYFCQNGFNDYERLDMIELKVFLNEIDDTPDEFIMEVAQNQSILSLGKIKTIEYRIYRKIREKAKKLTLDNENNLKIRERFISECSRFCSDYGLNDKYDNYVKYYEQIQEKVIKRLSEGDVNTNKGRYNQNLNLIVNPSSPPIFLQTSWLAQSIDAMIVTQLNLQVISSNRNIDEFHKGTLYHNILDSRFKSREAVYYFFGFSQEDEENFIEKSKKFKNPKDFPPELIKYNSKVFAKEMEGGIRKTFNQQRELLDEYLGSNLNVKFFQFESNERIIEEIAKDLNLQINKPKEKIKVNYVLLVPVTIPGSGKTYHLEYFKKLKTLIKNSTVEVLNCDDLRKNIIENEKYSEKSFKEKFDSSSILLYDKIVEKMMSPQKGKQKSNRIFYLDKNFSFHSIKKLKEKLETEKINPIIIGMLPISYPHENSEYYLSVSYLFICLKRVLKRKQHLMNKNKSLDIVKIVLEIYKKLTKKSVNECKKIINTYIEIPYIVENNLFIDGNMMRFIDSVLMKNEFSDEDLQNIYDYAQDIQFDEVDCKNIIEESIKNKLEYFGLR